MEIYPAIREKTQSSEIGSLNGIPQSGGDFVKYCSWNMVTNGEGLSCQWYLVQFFWVFNFIFKEGQSQMIASYF